MKYNKHILKKDRLSGEAFDEPQTMYYQMEDTNMCGGWSKGARSARSISMAGVLCARKGTFP